jgi:hypothetical protein
MLIESTHDTLLSVPRTATPDVHRHYQLAFVYTVLCSRIGKNMETTANVGEKEETARGILVVPSCQGLEGFQMTIEVPHCSPKGTTYADGITIHAEQAAKVKEEILRAALQKHLDAVEILEKNDGHHDGTQVSTSVPCTEPDKMIHTNTLHDHGDGNTVLTT